MDPDLLEQIRLLSNIERQDTKLLNICFVGQNEFIDIISDNQQRALRQRIAINFHLDPLNESEVKAYIHHRLNVAGLKENIFSDSSIREIFSFSNGYPRLINIICDHALLTGYVNEVKTIDEGIIKECANGLFLTRGNKGYDKNDRKPIQGTMSMDEKVAPTTPSGYTGKSDLPKERGGYLHDNPATIERIAYSYGEKPTLKSSKKKYGYGVCALLLLLLLGFLYDPVNLGGHIDNIKTYFKPFPELKENNMSANIPQNTASRQNMNAVVKVVDKSSDTQLQPTGLVAESYHQPMIVEAVNDKEPLKESSINALPSAEDLSQDEYQDNSAKAQDAPVYDLIRTRKYIINFKYNSYDIAGDSLPILEGIAELLDQHAKIGIVVKGYTDAYGNPRYNTKLSKLRAGFVKSYLVDRGINASRIKALGLGEKSPIGSNDTIEGRKRNRRVEIELNINSA